VIGGGGRSPNSRKRERRPRQPVQEVQQIVGVLANSMVLTSTTESLRQFLLSPKKNSELLFVPGLAGRFQAKEVSLRPPGLSYPICHHRPLSRFPFYKSRDANPVKSARKLRQTLHPCGSGSHRT
jgi:hypothetical protein